MADGVYILRPEFVDRCEKENQFVCEEPFEWGNTSSCKITNSLNKRSGKTIAVLDNHSIHNILLEQLKDFNIPAVMSKYVFEYLDSGGDKSVMKRFAFVIPMQPTHSWNMY